MKNFTKAIKTEDIVENVKIHVNVALRQYDRK